MIHEALNRLRGRHVVAALSNLLALQGSREPSSVAARAAYGRGLRPTHHSGGAQLHMGKLSLDTRGAVMAEYVVLLCLVAALAWAAIAAMGLAMARYYISQQAWLLVPFP